MELLALQETAEAYERLKKPNEAVQVYQLISTKFASNANEAANARAKAIRLAASKEAPQGDVKTLWAMQKYLAQRNAPVAPEARKAD